MRKGMGKGKGKGYKNLIPKDPKVHSDSAMGRKQPQRIQRLPKGINMSKIFEIKDLSGRGFGKILMNQTELFRFMKADNYDKKTISNLYPGQKYLENRAIFIKRIK